MGPDVIIGIFIDAPKIARRDSYSERRCGTLTLRNVTLNDYEFEQVRKKALFPNGFS